MSPADPPPDDPAAAAAAAAAPAGPDRPAAAARGQAAAARGQAAAARGPAAASRGPDPLDLLAFNVKLLGQRSAKNVLLSAGKPADKRRLLPAVRKLVQLEQVDLFATPGTHRFLAEEGVDSTLIHKITEHRDPNILSFLRDSRIDLVVNVLTGDTDYDEDSDAKLIRSLSIRQNIPLITDPDIAEATLLQVVRDQEAGTFAYRVADAKEPWNLRLEFFELCRQRGGVAIHHAHFDKAYLISLANLRLSQVDMQRKWDLYKQLKESYTPDDLVERISRGAQAMVDQGVAYCRTMVDADSTCGLMPVKAALEVKKRFADRLDLEIGIQPLQGVLERPSREVYEEACGLADFCGGLPSRDRPTPEKHLDVILSIAKDLGKPVDVHVDQENDPDEHETEMLALKTIEHDMQGRVFGVHSVSLAAQPRHERERIAELLREAGVGVIVCPSAAISMKQLDVVAPSHNAIAPVPELLAAGVDCYLGVDNVHDLFLPLVDGDVWTECRILMEACRHYDLDAVAEIACRRVATAARP